MPRLWVVSEIDPRDPHQKCVSVADSIGERLVVGHTHREPVPQQLMHADLCGGQAHLKALDDLTANSDVSVPTRCTSATGPVSLHRRGRETSTASPASAPRTGCSSASAPPPSLPASSPPSPCASPRTPGSSVPRGPPSGRTAPPPRPPPACGCTCTSPAAPRPTTAPRSAPTSGT